MVVQFTSPGYMRHRFRNDSPMGLMARTTCKLARTRSTKNFTSHPHLRDACFLHLPDPIHDDRNFVLGNRLPVRSKEYC